jgi:hypothetical protein
MVRRFMERSADITLRRTSATLLPHADPAHRAGVVA